MKLKLLFAATMISLAACMKPEKEFYGSVQISGTATDKQTGKPISGAVVLLTGTVQKQGPIGYLEEYEPMAFDTTDANGAYAFSFEANGESSFGLNLQPSTSYLQYRSGAGNDNSVKGIGAHTLNLAGIRTGFAKVTLRHASSRTESRLNLVGPVDAFTLPRQRRDTTLILRLYGDNSTVSPVIFTADTARQTRNLTVAAGDTLLMQFDY